MPECAQVSALHIRPHFTTLRRNRSDGWLKYYRRNQENRFCVSHFWPTLQNHVTDGSKHMRHLDRGEIKLFRHLAYMPVFLIVSEIYGLKSRNGEKFEIFLKFLAHSVETPWPILTVLYQNVRMQVCALHTGPHLASLRKIEMVAVRSTNETTPNF